MAPSKWALEQVVFGKLIHLEEGRTTIGRNHRSNIVASSDYVSRNHAYIHVAPDSNNIEIRDLGSTNGIFVNDFQYCNAPCNLNVDDRIGIGVNVDNLTVSKSSEGKYPIYLLKYFSQQQAHTKSTKTPQEIDSNDANSQSPDPQKRKSQDDEEECAVEDTDDEYDIINEKDDFVLPQSRSVLMKVKKEQEPVRGYPLRKVSENIDSIFGHLHPELLSNMSEETRKIAETSINLMKPVASKDIICVSSSEDEDIDTSNKRQNTAKSPQLFGNSFNSDNNNSRNENVIAIMPADVSQVPKDDNISKISIIQISETFPNSPKNNNFVSTEVDKKTENPIIFGGNDKVLDNNPPIIDSPIENVKDEFGDEDDDLFFTQKIFDDMKEHAADLSDEEVPDFKIESEDSDLAVHIKQEFYPQNLDGTIINLDDEEDEIDENLKETFNNWSKLLCSRSFTNSFNASQVYEDENSDEEPTLSSKNIFIIEDDDDNEDIRLVERATTEGVVKTEPKDNAFEKKTRDVRNLQKTLFSSSEDKADDDDKPSTSSASLKKFHEKLVRRLSTSEEVPNKKPCLGSRSDDNELECATRPSSSHRTYSKRSSRSKRLHSNLANEEENIFEKLKNDEKSKKSSLSYSSNKKTPESKKSKNSSNLHVNETSKTTYKSATVARRKSIGSSIHKNIEEDLDICKHKIETTFPPEVGEENKRTGAASSVIMPLKVMRGPPEIIQPPALPTNRGKLRGISAAHKRTTETLKASSCQKELKRKWLEKPSAKKDKERDKALKEDRKKRLKELSDKKQSQKVNPACSTNGKSNVCEKEDSRKKPVVKITHANRGAFLTELPTSNPKPRYKIPKKQSIPKESSPKFLNEASKSLSKVLIAKNGENSLPAQQKPNTEIITRFAKELEQVDIDLEYKISTSTRDRHKSTDSGNELKQCAPPRRNNKKQIFATMNQHFEKKCLEENPSKKNKKVRFNLSPEIHYIESLSNAKRKTYQKESSTFSERKKLIRSQYPILNKTDNLLDDVLSWSQLWLENKQIDGNMFVFPMTNKFESYSSYKSTVLNLLKMEFLGHLAKSMEQCTSMSIYCAEIDYYAPHKHRDILFAKTSTTIKTSELAVNDLALIDIITGSKKSQYFGFIGNIRKSGSCNCIAVEVSSNTINKEVLKTKPKIKIRRVIDGLLMHLGTFNAVHQLEHTPLIKKILNPLDLLSVRNNYRTSSIEYKGFNPLNKEQRDILLKTYEKAIDQFNPSVSLINGPPGTGKSLLISNLAVQLLYGNEVHELDKKILICAQSNMAVDVIAEKLIKIKQKLSPDTAQFHVVRFGLEEKVHPNVKGITLKNLLQRHRLNFLRNNTSDSNDQTTNGKNLCVEIDQLEARIAELEKNTIQDVRQEELIEMRKNLALKKNIVNQNFRPEEERQLSRWFLENANIVCSTLSGCAKLAAYVDYFDVCIIDEATQCTEPWTLMPLKFGVSTLIMVGDTQQLPATVISQNAKELGLGTSLFTRIQKCLENNYRETPTSNKIREDENKPIFTLHEQYRMHSEISQWPNMYFYKNLLKNNPTTDEFKSSIRPFSILNLEYKQNDSHNGQISNSLEAEFVAKLVTTLDNYIPNKFFSYGVITPYAQHREKLERMIRKSGLTDVMVNTIDSYQGIEKDVIIISNARTHGVGFLSNYQRLNVALTRPKKCLILCGNFKNLETVPSWASLLANAKQRGLYNNISTSDASDITKNVIEKIKIKR